MQDLKITIIQSDLAWEDKVRNTALFSKLIETSGYTDIVILPEMFSTGFSMQASKLAEKMDGPTIEWMKATAAEMNIIITGSFIIEENENYYNRLIWMRPDGTYDFYNKRHLFSLAGENEIYTQGTERIIVEHKGWKICPLICYDLRFPVWSRNQDNYDLLLYVASWPERRMNAWTKLLTARAIENQCYVAGVNRIGSDGNNIYHSGNSLLIDPLGKTLWEMIHDRAVYTATLSSDFLHEVREKLPFLNDRDTFHIVNSE
ncbi:MAG: amidohydrolase [Chitinophagales bacterium]|nr:amidohydrolase [Chitinophagales bacterium]